MALVSIDTISVSGAVALLEHVASIEAKTAARGLIWWTRKTARATVGITS